VICYPEQDGPTEVMLGDVVEVDPHREPIFDGELATPSGMVTVSTASYEKLLEAAVTGAYTRIRVWISHPRWPEKVIVGLNWFCRRGAF
jgi:hypothetical protein